MTQVSTPDYEIYYGKTNISENIKPYLIELTNQMSLV